MWTKKETGVSEKWQSHSDKSGKSSCDRHNVNTFNQKLHGAPVNAAINVGKNNFCSGEIVFTHDWNIVVSLNLICGSLSLSVYIYIRKTTCKCCGGFFAW